MMNWTIRLFSLISTVLHSLLPSSTKPGASAAAASCVCWPAGPEAGPTKDDVQTFIVYIPLSQSPSLDALPFHNFFPWVHKFLLVKLHRSPVDSCLDLGFVTLVDDLITEGLLKRMFSFPCSLVGIFRVFCGWMSRWFMCLFIFSHPRGDAVSLTGNDYGWTLPSLLWSSTQDPRRSQQLRDCLNWQPVRYWGVDFLSATFSFEEGVLQAGANLMGLSDRQRRSTALHPSIRAWNSPHALHKGFLELLWIGLSGRSFRPPTSLSPKESCVWSSLYDIISRGYTCPAALFAVRAVWSSKCTLKLKQSHEDSRWARKGWFQVKLEHSGI